MKTSTPSQAGVSYESIKLSIDAHAQYYWVSRQFDAATPEPAQKMTHEELMLLLSSLLSFHRFTLRPTALASSFWRTFNVIKRLAFK